MSSPTCCGADGTVRPNSRPSVWAQAASTPPCITTRFEQHLPHLAGHGPGKRRFALDQQVAHPLQHLAPHGAGVRDHCVKPRCADATARRTSSEPDLGNWPTRSDQSAGLRFSNNSPVEPSTQAPAMKFLKGAVIPRSPGRDARTDPHALRPGIADAWEHLAGGEREAPDDHQQREQVGQAKAVLPR